MLALWVSFIAFAMAYQWYVGPPLDVFTVLFCTVLVLVAFGLADKLGIIDLDTRRYHERNNTEDR